MLQINKNNTSLFPFIIFLKESGSGEDDRRSQPRR